MSKSLRLWFDSATEPDAQLDGIAAGDRIDWLRAAPFICDAR